MTQNDDNLKTIYQELCQGYRAIDDFRSKLLGYLPLASGAGIFLLISDAFTDATKRIFAESMLRPIGIFGLLVTIGLFLFEFHGIKKCSRLIDAGKVIEKDLKIYEGQFRTRPNGFIFFINEPFAAGIIYPTVIAAWTFIAFDLNFDTNYADLNLSQAFSQLWALKVLVVTFTFSLVYDLWLISGIEKLIKNLNKRKSKSKIQLESSESN